MVQLPCHALVFNYDPERKVGKHGARKAGRYVQGVARLLDCHASSQGDASDRMIGFWQATASMIGVDLDCQYVSWRVESFQPLDQPMQLQDEDHSPQVWENHS